VFYKAESKYDLPNYPIKKTGNEQPISQPNFSIRCNLSFPQKIRNHHKTFKKSPGKRFRKPSHDSIGPSQLPVRSFFWLFGLLTDLGRMENGTGKPKENMILATKTQKP